jgi:hypothetical protein
MDDFIESPRNLYDGFLKYRKGEPGPFNEFPFQAAPFGRDANVTSERDEYRKKITVAGVWSATD